MKIELDELMKIAKRAGELADMRLDDLRAHYPEATGSQAEIIQLCKERGLSRGMMIRNILLEDYKDA